jgi:hypothetical protein
MPYTPPSPLPPERLCQWDRSMTIGLSKASCFFCHGYGMLPVLNGDEQPCKCVFRAVYRACLRRMTECQQLSHHTGRITWDRCGGPSGYRVYSRKREEFIADFCGISRRVLEDLDYEIQRLHHVLHGDWTVCCRALHIDRGTFFHRVYIIEELAGRAFAECEPYALYPVAGYFAGSLDSNPIPCGAGRRVSSNRAVTSLGPDWR